MRAMRTDAVLDPAIAPATACPATATATARQVLLTGATGFLGSHLLATLLTRPDVVVHCLVRAADEGLDVPDADQAVITSGTLNPRQRIQRLGRALHVIGS